MITFNHIFKNDYDKRIKLGGEPIFIYSVKKMKELYPDGNFTLVGESSGKKAKKDEERIGTLIVGKNAIDVHPEGRHGKFLNKVDGYLCVGDNKYVAIHKSRIPFLATLLALLLLLVATILLILWLLQNPKPPVIINPDNPLPEIDPDIETIEQDTSEKVTSEEGGGFVNMIYTKSASISLTTEKAKIHFKNPNASNHNVLIEFYIVSDENKYFVGKTGLVPAGTAIYEIDVSEREVDIREGIYTGLYRVYYYDSETGERATVGSDIVGISVSVEE